MKITDREKSLTLVKAAHQPKPRGIRQPKPGSAIAQARELGMHPSTWRARLRKVEAGKMTLEEAKTLPVGSASQVGRKYGKPNFASKVKASIEEAVATGRTGTQRRAGK